MEFHEIKLLLDQTAVRILRGQNSAMVLGFLHRAFKSRLRVAIPEGELQAMLETYLEDLRLASTDSYPDSAADYLNRWCEDDYGFLRKYYGDTGQEPLYELTSGSEKGLVWLEYVFSYRGEPHSRMNNSAWRKARARAGLPQVRVHDLRHTFGHRLRAAGVSFEDRQDLLGHKSERMTTHYSAAELSQLIRSAELLCEQRPATILRVVGK